MAIGRPRKISSPEEMDAAWEQYKLECDNQKVIVHEFSSKHGDFISKELLKPVTYTIEGFCIFVDIARSNFYETYSEDETYRNIVARIREECEVDVRKKFEMGVIPTQLAALWMSKYGYSTKTDNTISAGIIQTPKWDEITTDELRRLAALEEQNDSERGEE